MLPDRNTVELVTICLNDAYDRDNSCVFTGLYRITPNTAYDRDLPDITG